MKRFSFSLDRVRAWRQEQADMEQMKLAGMLTALQAIGAERCQVLAERSEAEASTDRACAADMIQLTHFRRHLAQREQTLITRENEQKSLIQAQRHRLLEARRQCELLHTLREKQFAAWRAGAAKEQEELAAELFLARRKPA